MMVQRIGHLRVAEILFMKARLSAKLFICKENVCISMKNNFHNKNFAISLAFTMRFKATLQCVL